MDLLYLLLIVMPLGTAVAMPYLCNKPWPVYWGTLTGLIVISLVTWHRPGEVNSELSVGVFLVVLPGVLCFSVCRLPFLRQHRLLVVVCAPVSFVLGVLLGLSLAVTNGFMSP